MPPPLHWWNFSFSYENHSFCVNINVCSAHCCVNSECATVHYACSITLYLLTCLLTHSPTYPLTHSHTHSLTHSLTLLCSQLVLILWSAIISVNQLNLVTTMMELLVTIASSRNIISEALSSLSVLLKQYLRFGRTESET